MGNGGGRGGERKIGARDGYLPRREASENRGGDLVAGCRKGETREEAYRYVLRSKGIQPSLRDHELDSPISSDVAEQYLCEKILQVALWTSS